MFSKGLVFLTQVNPPNWYEYYWPAKPIYGIWFNAGQVQSNGVGAVKSAGFKTVINTRKGSVTSGEASQEEVTLLNIQDKTGTYTGRSKL